MEMSVIIPVHNGVDDLRRCLEALRSSTRLPDEIILVDDASTDAPGQLASQFGALVLAIAGHRLGPAKARNQGAASAQGDILVFIDADIMVHRDTLAAIEESLSTHPEIAALFGSYDDAPAHRSLVSLYKNLQHHYIHQHGNKEASTFWTGIGAIRRKVFLQIGGFDENYIQPSIEDIELGVRLHQAGYAVWLCPDIQVTHLKRWTLFSLLRSDIFQRAVPWTRLILATSQLPADLNLDKKSRLSALLAWAFLTSFGLGFWLPLAWCAALLLLGALLAINFPFYRFFYRKNGLWFTVRAFPLHLLYFLYSSFTFTIIWIGHLFSANYRSKDKPVWLDEL